nr:transposase [Moraxella bovis]
MYNNTMTSTLFETWFEQMLLPCLNNHTKQTGKPCIIILDNARFHRMKHLQALINNIPYKQIILPLPPYSPKLNPIEQTWATVKRWLRSHLSEFDTIEEGLKCYFGVWWVYHRKYRYAVQWQIYQKNQQRCGGFGGWHRHPRKLGYSISGDSLRAS